MQTIEVEQLITQNLADSRAIIQSPDGVHFDGIIISASFAGQSKLARTRQVYAFLGPHISSGAIHALSLKTYTPDEWQALPQES